ncbi:CoA pyrophosphatase [Pseudoxanthomonas suwonensis]|uniref:DNA mismatch repair protein MutT n=1 Tax=Pseudoxanthomonas suwonensis TaxID=314722 RepID=A0A0E3Z611_9GAMM|nr:DNA mismatch repair protein MutT [Pseudoxanthomonas suwonensis]
MSLFFPPASATSSPSSPCIRVCRIDADGLCRGCLRTGDEIARWSRLDEGERRRLMETVLADRARERFRFLEQLREHDRVSGVLHPLRDPPGGDGWNRSELDDLLPREASLAEAAVLVGLVPRDAGTQVLLTRRTDALRHHGGQVSFPGGRVERDDAGVLGAALRESQEEIALAAAQVAPLGYLDPFLTISGFRVTPVVAAIDPDYVPRPHPDEVAEVFEVPFDFLMSAGHLHQVEMEFRGRRRSVLEYDWPGQRIWGATAAILYNLRRRLEEGA